MKRNVILLLVIFGASLIIVLTSILYQKPQGSVIIDYYPENSGFVVWPYQYDLSIGKKLIASAIIENNALDNRDHFFVLHVLPAHADDIILSTKGCTEVSSTCPLYNEMLDWVSYNTEPFFVKARNDNSQSISFDPNTDAMKGTYLFNVVSCYDKDGTLPVSEDCTSYSSNLWGESQQSILLRIE